MLEWVAQIVVANHPVAVIMVAQVALLNHLAVAVAVHLLLVVLLLAFEVELMIDSAVETEVLVSVDHLLLVVLHFAFAVELMIDSAVETEVLVFVDHWHLFNENLTLMNIKIFLVNYLSNYPDAYGSNFSI